jgi:transcriptional regulator with XRE-family HTH domain
MIAIIFGGSMIKVFLAKLIEAGWTQKKIADKTGTSQEMISRFLKGKTCTVETLIKIATAFEVSTDTVLGLDRPEPPMIKSNTMADHGVTFKKQVDYL